ncbi:HNH endonuclease [Bacillus toyonensis]|uniref:HNH endonuclease n=1 Tax=Bacillus toyonensis TaxID=155322 RepID=UPI003466CDEB
MNLTGLKGNAKADKLFYTLLLEIKKRKINITKEFTVLEIASLIPLGTVEISNHATYGYSFTSMLSNQKNRDYFIFQNPSVQEKLTSLANNHNRNNYRWKTEYGNEKVKINSKYWMLINENVKRHSWGIVSEDIVIKELDKSAFLHHGTGIPQDIRGFFDATDMESGERREIILEYRQNVYHAHLEMDKQSSPRSRLLWRADFSEVIRNQFPFVYSYFLHDEDKLFSEIPKLRFKKRSSNLDVYSVEFLNPIDSNVLIEDLESEEIEWYEPRTEGNLVTYYGRRYERDPVNRKRAIEVHGLSCVACGFNFEEVYGERGKDFIEVHHVKPLSTIGEEVVVDPRKDLVPVCSNCHRMIHRRKDNVLTVEELEDLVQRRYIIK